ncbi:hypothetical protein BXZ70DRAFT_907034 [Cristinia sonorae]|uniref:Uncharacterized protein n=1 Tax=Cristinia sonorae TaxID=1940300 RepID=A0A8K0UP37_9AGAR|nr:hypothetical protein BXZ70DRAFT_907034 [Cristinia sonorae]
MFLATIILQRAVKCVRQNEWLNWPNMRRDTKPVQAAEFAVEYTGVSGKWLNWPNMRRDIKPVQAAEFAVEYTAAGGEVCVQAADLGGVYAGAGSVRANRVMAEHAARYKASTGGRICGGVYCGEQQSVRAKISGKIGGTCGEIQSQYRRRDLWWSIPPVINYMVSGQPTSVKYLVGTSQAYSAAPEKAYFFGKHRAGVVKLHENQF